MLPEELLSPYYEDAGSTSGGEKVFHFVPVTIVDAVFEKHGGIAGCIAGFDRHV